MSWIRVGTHLIEEDEIIAISLPPYGSNEYAIRLRGSEALRVAPSNDEYCVKNLYERYLSNVKPQTLDEEPAAPITKE